jgi:hypothetical protein
MAAQIATDFIGMYARARHGVPSATREKDSIGMIATIIWPVLVMSRHRRRQDRLLDRIRAAYVLACENLITAHERATDGRLRAIRRMERRWHFGASMLYRFALTAYAATSNRAIAVTVAASAHRLVDPQRIGDVGRHD